MSETTDPPASPADATTASSSGGHAEPQQPVSPTAEAAAAAIDEGAGLPNGWDDTTLTADEPRPEGLPPVGPPTADELDAVATAVYVDPVDDPACRRITAYDPADPDVIAPPDEWGEVTDSTAQLVDLAGSTDDATDAGAAAADAAIEGEPVVDAITGGVITGDAIAGLMSAGGINLGDYSRDARARGWGAGWPTDRRSEMATITADRSGVKFAVHRRIARLVDLVVDAMEARGYLCRPGQCWGFAGRYIRGTRVPSNHSWGLAFDVNSLANPMKRPLTTDMPRWITELWNRYGFAHGRDYTSTPDPMHGEFMGTPEQADQMTALAERELGGAGGGGSTPAPPPANGAPPFPLPGGYYYGPKNGPKASISGQHHSDRAEWRAGLRTWQQRMIDIGFGRHFARYGADGMYGATINESEAAAAARDLQLRHGLAVDGLIGPKTWAAAWAPQPSPAPLFPLPAGYYYGPKNGPRASISCQHPTDQRAWRVGLQLWQQRMIDIGYGRFFARYGADGMFGTTMAESEAGAAARQLQQDRGLAVDGLIGPDTWAAAWA